MTTIGKFLRLPYPKKSLLVRVIALLCVIRLSLHLLPFRWVSSMTALLPGNREAAELSRRRIATTVWAVEAATRLARWSCLERAFAVQFILKRRGYPAALCIGVARDSDRLDAHAWLEVGGVVVIGGSKRELERYTLLTRWNGAWH